MLRKERARCTYDCHVTVSIDFDALTLFFFSLSAWLIEPSAQYTLRAKRNVHSELDHLVNMFVSKETLLTVGERLELQREARLWGFSIKSYDQLCAAFAARGVLDG